MFHNIFSILTVAKSPIQFDAAYEVYRYNYTRRYDPYYKPIETIYDAVTEATTETRSYSILDFNKFIPDEIFHYIQFGDITFVKQKHWDSLLSRITGGPYTYVYSPTQINVYLSPGVKRSEVMNVLSVAFKLSDNDIKLHFIRN